MSGMLLITFMSSAVAHAGPSSTCRKRCSDSQAPTLTIGSPVESAVVSGIVTVSGTASDNVGVTKVEMNVDGGVWRLAAGTGSWSTSLDTRAIADGTHRIVARAIDAAGNMTERTVSFSVKNQPVDDVAPLVSIAAPAASATISGITSVTGNASDAGGLSKVEMRVDADVWQEASGTSFWSRALDTTTLADGTHTITARASDMAGNVSFAAVTVNVRNAPSDTIAPTAAIETPQAGVAYSATLNASGSAADNVAVGKVEVRVDAGTWRQAAGTSAWASAIDTTTLADGSHLLAVRVADTAGNVTVITREFLVANQPSERTGAWVSPEGTTIDIAADVSGWSHAAIHRMLVENGLDARVGATLTVKVQTQYASAVASSASESGGRYDAFTATMYLKATANSGFTNAPDATVSHEFGHVWTLYHLYMSQQNDWSSWLSARGIAGDPRLESSYNWAKNEIIADDYRLLFGSSAAIAQRPAHLNSDLPDPRNVPGLKDFFLNSWSVGVPG